VRREEPSERPWQEAEEREPASIELPLKGLLGAPVERPFELTGGQTTEGGASRSWERISGRVTVAATHLAPGLARLTARIENRTPRPSDPQPAAMMSTHFVLRAEGGSWVSLTDPPEALRDAASGCRQEGLWPVLVGEPGTAEVMLASPIILEDHPRIAPESPQDLFDGTEIDEILSLRILTLSDAEKAELRRTDPRAAALLDRTEALTPDEFLRLHGTLRDPGAGAEPPADLQIWGEPEPLEAVPWIHGTLRVGDRVRLCPAPGADVMDLCLGGRSARVESILQELEGRVQVAVLVDDDPGADLGEQRLPGHRFFFQLHEVAPL